MCFRLKNILIFTNFNKTNEQNNFRYETWLVFGYTKFTFFVCFQTKYQQYFVTVEEPRLLPRPRVGNYYHMDIK